MTTHLIRLGVLVLALCMSITVWGQDTPVTSDDAYLRQYNMIDDVELIQTDAATQFIIRSTLPDGCDFPTVVEMEREGNILFIDLYRDVPIDVICPMMLQTDEQTVDASMLYEYEAQADGTSGVIDLIVVNDRVFHIERAQIEDTGENVQPPMRLSPWNISPISVIRIETVLADGEMSLNIPWVPLSGCEGPLVSRVRPIAHSENAAYEIIMFQATSRDPASEGCPPLPMLFTPFEQTLVVDHDPTQEASFSWDTMTLYYKPDFSEEVPTNSDWSRNPVTIEPDGITTIVAESFPPQVFLTVNWQAGGPCVARYYEVLDQRNGNDVTITITEVLAEESICGRALLPMSISIPLGMFEDGVGTITVNGVVANS